MASQSQYEFDDGRDSDNEGGEDYTATDAGELKQALINEKAAPEILQYEADLMGRLDTTMQHQELVLERMQGDKELGMARTIILWDLNRVKYMMRTYLRTRLQKIEKYVMHILDSEEMRDCLSEKEYQFAQDYFMAWGKLARDDMLQHLPPHFVHIVRESSSSQEKDIVQLPKLDKHVFSRVMQNLGDIDLEDDGSVTTCNKGDVMVTRYSYLRELLKEGKFVLL